ncbi:chemotaxis protein CheZ [Kineobactrum sediminis]|uniref:Protein phosphatase CheZ n=1 Tax=Kineobactrum sediminis TaxID=1905677 RepID=A0A2N5Y6D0_9GAMM|nr:protein phosphatase CheZ [Kineobactrum sediminis]PLW83960.1 chemotaxis protein CheZ [Kineobactrum sediminis]
MTMEHGDKATPDKAVHRSPGDYLAIIEPLMDAAHADDETAFFTLLDDLTAMREKSLFQDVGHLTRQLHEALTNFQLDSRVADLASEEFPDARQRLDQVIALTEQSAHKTMDAVEEMMPQADALITRATVLDESWNRFLRRDQSADDFRAMVGEVSEFIEETGAHAAAIKTGLSDVLISQNFQDLSGQEIRKVIHLVHEVEETLINMIRMTGRAGVPMDRKAAVAAPLPSDGEHRVTSQDEADELLSSLGF